MLKKIKIPSSRVPVLKKIKQKIETKTNTEINIAEDIIIKGDGTLKTARLQVLDIPWSLHYPSIAVWYNSTYSLIDYEIDRSL